MNWSVNFDKDIMRDKPLKRLLKASPWLKKIKREPYPGTYLSTNAVSDGKAGIRISEIRKS